MSYATIFIPGSGVIDSFGGNMDEFNQAVSLYLITWFIITTLFMCVAFFWEKLIDRPMLIGKFGRLPVMRRNIALTVLLTALAIALLLLSIGSMNGKASYVFQHCYPRKWLLIMGLV